MKESKFPKKGISHRAREIPAVIMMLLIAGLSAPVFADTPEEVPKDEAEFLGPAYEQESRGEGWTDPRGIAVVPVTGLIVPAARVSPPPYSPPPYSPPQTPPGDLTEEEGGTGEQGGSSSPSGTTEQSPRPPDRDGGEWRWDEDLGQWIFDEANPLANMEFIGEGGSLPLTGFAGVLAGIPRSVLALLAGVLAGIPRSASALLACLLFPAAVIPLLRRRKEEKPVPRAGVR